MTRMSQRPSQRPSNCLAIAALAALLAIGAPDPGAGQDAAARPAPAFRSAAPARHVVDADDGHPLTVWEKRGAGAGAGGVVLLLHGRTWSSLPDFDLQVPGEDLSLMDALAEAGYAVYALDARGYGDTPRDDTGWLTPDRMARDVAGVLGWIAGREDAAARPALFGWSQQPVVVF